MTSKLRRTLGFLGGAAAAGVFVSLLASAESTAAQAQAPSNTSAPTVSGTVREGRTLTGTTGIWAGASPVSFAFQWLRCDPANVNLCAAVARATSPTYVLVSADVGRRVRIRVTATNAEGSSSALSAPTDIVVSNQAPRNTAEPRISGTPAFQATLTASRGSWTGGTPITYAYQWLRCDAGGGAPDGSNCPAIPGATTSRYVIGNADVGQRLRVRVTATNAFGAATATSNATSAIPPAGSRPVNAAPPTATGSYVQGQVLRASEGTWRGTQPIAFSFQWLRCNRAGDRCAEITAATGREYLIRSADVGSTLRLRVTARNSLGSATAVSGPTQVVVATGAPPPTGVITLPNGERSVSVANVPAHHRLAVERVVFAPNPVRSLGTIITVRIKIKDTRGFVVRDALVFLRSTPVVTTQAPTSQTGLDGWVQFNIRPESDFQIRTGYSVQFFVKAYRQGDPPLAGVAGYRLVQVGTAP